VSANSRPAKDREALDRFVSPLEIAAFERQATTEYRRLRAALEKKGRLIGSMDLLIAQKLPRPLNGTVETTLTRGSSRDMLVGIAPGQSLRMSAFNADGSRPDTEKAQSIRMQVNVYDEDGTVVVISREVEIAAGHFGSIDVERRDLPMAGEPDTGRARVRVKPLFAFPPVWNGRVVTSLEIVDSAGNTTSDPQCLVFFLGGTPSH
jgi:hypothetical protein